jgi:hypothetical protein
MKRYLFFSIAVVVALMVASCEKGTRLTEEDLNIAEDDAITEAIFDDIFNSVDIASILLEETMKSGFPKGEYIAADSCPVITVDHPEGTIWPKTVTIDYGEGCTLNDVTRKGKIIIVVTGMRHVTGSSRTVSFNDYYFNDIKVEGTKTIQNMGPNSNQNIVISITLEGGKILLPDGKSIEREVDREREWIAGFNTPRFIWDDECLVSGTTTGKTIKDVEYTTTIVTPLHWKRVCRFIVAGIIRIAPVGGEPAELDFGEGECDALATLRRGDEVKTINLRVRHRLMQ